MSTEKLFMDAFEFCFKNKIPFVLHLQAEINSAHYEVENDKPKFIINVCNEEDKNLPNIVNNGLENLKNFIQEVSRK